MKLRKLKTKELTALSLLIALNVVMAELMKIKVIPGVLEFSLGFLPIAVTGMLFGPMGAIVVAVIADILGALIFAGGNFYFGYTLTAFLTGLFYGLLRVWPARALVSRFGKRIPADLIRILIIQALVSLICYAGLNTLWAWLMGYGRSMEYVRTRLIVNAVAYPVYSAILFFLGRYRNVLEKAVK